MIGQYVGLGNTRIVNVCRLHHGGEHFEASLAYFASHSIHRTSDTKCRIFALKFY
jgi:hypothetical protein